MEGECLFKADDLAIGNDYSKGNSPVVLAIPTTVQLANSIGYSNLKKLLLLQRVPATLDCMEDLP